MWQREAFDYSANWKGTIPASSVKDRAAASMICRAEKRGDLQPGMTLIEPTSGNTGIALAMIAAVKGYPIELVMPANSTAERIQRCVRSEPKSFSRRLTNPWKERSTTRESEPPKTAT